MKQIVSILIISVFFMQCDHKDHGSHSNHSPSDLTKELKLDNGKKWKADAPAYEGIQSIGSLLETFHSQQEAKVGDYHRLSKDISTHLDLILKECKMKGEGHDQLHIVLHAIMQDAEALAALKESNEGDPLVHQTMDNVNLFYQYFEKP